MPAGTNSVDLGTETYTVSVIRRDERGDRLAAVGFRCDEEYSGVWLVDGEAEVVSGEPVAVYEVEADDPVEAQKAAMNRYREDAGLGAPDQGGEDGG